MRGRFPRRTRGSGPQEDPVQREEIDRQPGLSLGEVRLLAVRRGNDAVLLDLDDGCTLEVAAGSIPPGLPDPGDVIPPAVLDELRLAAERKQVARLIFAILDRRLYPVAGIRDKVLAKGYSPQAVQAVLEQMVARGLYSDRRYAEAYCRDCLATRAVGRRYLVSKLRGKRVPAQVASAVAKEILDAATEEEVADRAAVSRWKRMRTTDDRKALAAVVRFLQGRGFDAGTANRAARRTKPAGGDS